MTSYRFSTVVFAFLLSIPMVASAQVPGSTTIIERVVRQLADTLVSDQLTRYISRNSVLIRNLDGQRDNIVYGLCSNTHWPQARELYGIPAREDVNCLEFDQSTGFSPESHNTWEYIRCWVESGDCGYHTFAGWYFDFRFPNPRFTVRNQNPRPIIDTEKRLIEIDYEIGSLAVTIPKSGLRWRHWTSDPEYQDLLPPEYPNSWQRCCEANQWPGEGEWNTFSQRLSLNNIRAHLTLSYSLNLRTGEVIIYFNRLQLEPIGATAARYDLEDVFRDGSIGREILQEPLRQGIEKLLVTKINEIIGHINRRYGALPRPLELVRLRNPVALNVGPVFLDLDLTSYLTQFGSALRRRTNFLKDLRSLIDTDRDGLSDWDEISRYGTDPNRADTDGDGMNDGDEVRSGRNPKLNEPAIVQSIIADLLMEE